MLRKFQRLISSGLIFAILLMFSSSSNNRAYSATVNSVSVTNAQCSPLDITIWVYGNFTSHDATSSDAIIFPTTYPDGSLRPGSPVDLIGFRIFDGEGNLVFQRGFDVRLDESGRAIGVDSSNILGFPVQNPLTVYVYEATFLQTFNAMFGGNVTYGNLLASTSFELPCLPSVPLPPSSTDPHIAEEQANGIVRLFDDGIVIARQPNGDFDYYLANGCFIGRSPKTNIENSSLYERYIVQSLDGCNGYHIDLWSLGYPACQLQINMYGPNGYQKVFQLARQESSQRCSSSLPAQITLTAPYTTCEHNITYTGPSELSNDIFITQGFVTAASSCDEQRGAINYRLVLFGGQEGNYEAHAYGHVGSEFTADFTGTLKIETVISTSGKMGTASGTATAIPDESVIRDFVLPGYLSNFLEIATGLINGGSGGVRTDAYLYIDTGISEHVVTKQVGKGLVSSFPLVFYQNSEFNGEQTSLSISIPVTQGQTISIMAGINTTATVNRWAEAHWNPSGSSESFVTSFTLTEVR